MLAQVHALSLDVFAWIFEGVVALLALVCVILLATLFALIIDVTWKGLFGKPLLNIEKAIDRV